MDLFQQHTAALFTRLSLENALDAGDNRRTEEMSRQMDLLTRLCLEREAAQEGEIA